MATVNWWYQHRLKGCYTNNTLNVDEISRLDELRSVISHNVPSLTKPKDRCVYELTLPLDCQEQAVELVEGSRDLFDINSVTAEVLARVNEGGCYFLLNNCREAWMESAFISKIQRYFLSRNVDLSSVICVSNAANCDELYDGDMHMEHVPVFLKDHSDFYDVSTAKMLCDPGLRTDHTHAFLCYNYNYHAQRVLLLPLLAQRGLLDRGLVSMPAQGYRGSYEDAYREYWHTPVPHSDHITMGQALGLDRDAAHSLRHRWPMELASGFGRHIQDRAVNAPQQYISTVVSLVTETFFFRDEIHITEKTYKPISFMHPFILAATPHSLSWLRAQGFKTFSDFWDESYDNELDHCQRLLKIVDIVADISRWSSARQQQFYHAVWPVLEHNRRQLKLLERDLPQRQQFSQRWGV